MTREDLIGYIQSAIPYLEEAWTACFHGQKERLLSCEERGMGTILRQFKAIADGKRVIPLGLVAAEESAKRVEDALAWAHRLLGDPNSLKPELRRWVICGETCADGLAKADARVRELERKLAECLGRG